jgi:hypothetical protein
MQATRYQVNTETIQEGPLIRYQVTQQHQGRTASLLPAQPLRIGFHNHAPDKLKTQVCQIISQHLKESLD